MRQTRTPSRFTLAAIGLAPLAVGLLPLLAEGAQDFRWQGRVAAGQAIEVKGVNGSVEARAGSGSEVQVTAVKRGRRSNPDSVQVQVVEHGGGVTICAVYPAPSGERANECAPGSAGRMNTRDNDVTVEFVVSVPPGVNFVGRTVNGQVTARDLPGDADVHTVNGQVVVEAAGHTLARTVNGSIEARMGRADWSGEAEFATVNGSIKLELPADAGADVEARTVNGDIETDFPLEVRGKISRRRLSGTIGGGGRRLSLETVNGSIHVQKAP
jgi:Putative adhesin